MRPLWQSAVTTTSKLYDGPALAPGHTYYWLAVGADSGDKALSATEISKFVVL